MLRHQASQRERKETTTACCTHPAKLLQSGSTNSPPVKPQSLQLEDPVTMLLLFGFLSCLTVALHKSVETLPWSRCCAHLRVERNAPL
ncbi:hypothetical protein CHARACLAT_005269 [Characodon lateralis]|uniref:Uncharacterized protein n=1 Tax=Characodon lateralis TaxID=208331 RepID=A0ABU7DZJ5_9TELE|nr:hypothetical protein [Characodon lateralis]